MRDLLHGSYTGVVDDFVLRRNDGVTAYNLAVVVDDAAQGIDQVVRGDDLLPSTPRQAYFAVAARSAVPEYAHVPLVVNADEPATAGQAGRRRSRSPTWRWPGWARTRSGTRCWRSLGLPPGRLDDALAAFDTAALPREPWVWPGVPGAHKGAHPGTGLRAGRTAAARRLDS